MMPFSCYLFFARYQLSRPPALQYLDTTCLQFSRTVFCVYRVSWGIYCLLVWFLTGSQGLKRDVVYLGWPIAPSCGGGVAWSQPMSTTAQYTGAQINFGDLTPYLTYAGSALQYCYRTYNNNPWALCLLDVLSPWARWISCSGWEIYTSWDGCGGPAGNEPGPAVQAGQRANGRLAR